MDKGKVFACRANAQFPKILPAAVLLAVATLPAQSQIWNQNLIANGDAEMGSGMSVIDPVEVVTVVPKWTTNGAFTVVQYSCDDCGGPTPDDPGPVDRGRNFFAGGFGPATSSAKQTIDLSPGKVEIDAGRVRFYLSAYLMIADYGSSSRTPILTATFKDGAGNTLLTSVVNGPLYPEGSDLQVRTTSGFLLPNTRSVDILIDLTDPTMGGAGDNFNMSVADDLSLVLTVESLLGQNLVVNGDAETSPSKDHAFSQDWPVPGWNLANTWREEVGVWTYEQARIPNPNPTAVNRGHLFVAYGHPAALITQSIDVSLDKERIDSGSVTYRLSGDLGVNGSVPDNTEIYTTTLTGEFFDATGKVLGQGATTISEADLPGVMGLLSKAVDGQVPAGTRSIRVTVTFSENVNATDSLFADNISLVLNAAGGPVLLNSISNAATNLTGPVAPGEMVMLAVTGVNLNATVGMQEDLTGGVATSLGNVSVFFDGWKAPLLSVNSSLIEAIVPFGVSGQTSSVVRVEYQGTPSNNVTATVAAAAPGIFTQPPAGNSDGLIYDQQWTLISKSNPALKGSTVSILFTGAGQTNPGGIDGHIENLTQADARQPVSVIVDGQTADLVYAGTVPMLWDGLMMAQVKVPGGASTIAAVPVVITVGTISSPARGATMWVK